MKENQSPISDGLLELSAREKVAIQLRVPNSGTPWLDEMIWRANSAETTRALLLADATYVKLVLQEGAHLFYLRERIDRASSFAQTAEQIIQLGYEDKDE